MSNNHHGEWVVLGSDEWLADLEKRIGAPIPENDERRHRICGPPDLGVPQCSYCGSMRPEDFVSACENPDIEITGSDWKYGYPHKFYLNIPNPKSDELRLSGRRYGGEELLSDEELAAGWVYPNDPRVAHIDLGGARAVQFSTYQLIHAKFYSEHLKDWPGLGEAAEKIKERTGIMFAMKEHGLWWYAPSYGYQGRTGSIR